MFERDCARTWIVYTRLQGQIVFTKSHILLVFLVLGVPKLWTLPHFDYRKGNPCFSFFFKDIFNEAKQSYLHLKMYILKTDREMNKVSLPLPRYGVKFLPCSQLESQSSKV